MRSVTACINNHTLKVLRAWSSRRIPRAPAQIHVEREFMLVLQPLKCFLQITDGLLLVRKCLAHLVLDRTLLM